MTKTEARRTIKDVMATTFDIDPDEIEDTTTQKDIATWSSLAHLRLITNLEQALGVRFTMKEAAALTSFAEIEKAVQSQNA